MPFTTGLLKTVAVIGLTLQWAEPQYLLMKRNELSFPPKKLLKAIKMQLLIYWWSIIQILILILALMVRYMFIHRAKSLLS